LRFLRHIERTRTLAFLIALDTADPQQEYELLRSEVASYSEELASKPHCVVVTKADLLGPDDAPPHIDAPDACGQFVVSSVTRRGLDELLEALWTQVRAQVEEETGVGDADEQWRP